MTRDEFIRACVELWQSGNEGIIDGNTNADLLAAYDEMAAEIELCHQKIDTVLDNRNVGMCTGDSKLSYRLAELVHYYTHHKRLLNEVYNMLDLNIIDPDYYQEAHNDEG